MQLLSFQARTCHYVSSDAPDTLTVTVSDGFEKREHSTTMKNLFARFIREESGQDLIEYAFLAVFIALVVILGLQAVGTSVNSRMSSIASQVSGAS